jgi:hypothetical protein
MLQGQSRMFSSNFPALRIAEILFLIEKPGKPRHPTRGPSRVAAISETWSCGATADKDGHYCFASSYDAAARRAGGSYPPGPKIAFTGGLESTITA